MNSKIIYVLSILIFSVVILLSLLISGCTKIAPSNLNNTASKLVLVKYTPMQCEITPWNAWLTNSSIRFIKVPTEPEVITMFYGQEYNITLTNISIIKISDVTCMACGVCSKGYNIDADIADKDVQVMNDTGWKVLLNQ